MVEVVVVRLAEDPPCPQPVEGDEAVVVVFDQEIGTGWEIVVVVVVFTQEVGPGREALAVMMLAVVVVFAQEVGPEIPAETLEMRPRRLMAKIKKDVMVKELATSRSSGRYLMLIKKDVLWC